MSLVLSTAATYYPDFIFLLFFYTIFLISVNSTLKVWYMKCMIGFYLLWCILLFTLSTLWTHQTATPTSTPFETLFRIRDIRLIFQTHYLHEGGSRFILSKIGLFSFKLIHLTVQSSSYLLLLWIFTLKFITRRLFRL